jgi:hypothetical protein
MRWRGDLQVRGDPGVIPAAGRSQHDQGPQPVPVRRLRAPGAFHQGRTLGGGQRDRHSAGQRHSSSRDITTRPSNPQARDHNQARCRRAQAGLPGAQVRHPGAQLVDGDQLLGQCLDHGADRGGGLGQGGFQAGALAGDRVGGTGLLQPLTDLGPDQRRVGEQAMWLWHADPGPRSLDELWRAYLARFDIEDAFKLLEGVLGLTAAKVRAPEQADRWVRLLIAAHAQLLLARPLAGDLRRP